MISMAWDMGVNMAIMVLDCLFVAGSDMNRQAPPSTVKSQCNTRYDVLVECTYIVTVLNYSNLDLKYHSLFLSQEKEWKLQPESVE
jgi:hypothetical protein